MPGDRQRQQKRHKSSWCQQAVASLRAFLADRPSAILISLCDLWCTHLEVWAALKRWAAIGQSGLSAWSRPSLQSVNPSSPMARLALALAALLGVAAIAAAEQQQKRVLMLLNDQALEGSLQTFVKSLRARGYAVDTKAISDSSLQLKNWDDWLYDKLVIFGSNKGMRSAGTTVASAGGAGYVGRAGGRGQRLAYLLAHSTCLAWM